jgi:hypothetical protein
LIFDFFGCSCSRLASRLTQVAPHGVNGQYARRQHEFNNDESIFDNISDFEFGDSSTIGTSRSLAKLLTASSNSDVTRPDGDQAKATMTVEDSENSQFLSRAQWEDLCRKQSDSVKTYFGDFPDARNFIPKRVMDPLNREAKDSVIDHTRLQNRKLLRAGVHSDKKDDLPELTPCLSALSAEFFSELQSAASHDNEKKLREIDRQILMRPPPRQRRGDSSSEHAVDRENERARKKEERDSVRLGVREKIKKKNAKLSIKYGKQRMTTNVVLDPINLSSNNNKDDESVSLASNPIKLDIDRSVTPRTRYLSACLREGLAPLPHAILRSQLTSTLSLAHCGLGDRMGCLLAEVIHLLPMIESVNLCDNNLTDDSLSPLLHSILTINTLKVLDLSRNKIDGESAEALADFLSDPECTLERLVLQSADVDDIECNEFIEKLNTNRNLRGKQSFDLNSFPV